VTFEYLEKAPFREKIKQRMTELYNYPKFSSPFRRGFRSFLFLPLSLFLF
jgi:prolyl oligopeptidase